MHDLRTLLKAGHPNECGSVDGQASGRRHQLALAKEAEAPSGELSYCATPVDLLGSISSGRGLRDDEASAAVVLSNQVSREPLSVGISNNADRDLIAITQGFQDLHVDRLIGHQIDVGHRVVLPRTMLPIFAL